MTHVAADGRVRSVDLLRGIAALVVLVWHFQSYFNANPYGVLFAPFYQNGQVAVDIFFVISGFILMYVYHGKLQNLADLKLFVIKRLGRLYPLHLVTLVVVALIFGIFAIRGDGYGFVYSANDFFHFLLNLFLLQFVGLQKGFSFNAPSWTISGEFWINILFALVLLTTRRVLWIAGAIVVCSSAVLIAHGEWLSFRRIGPVEPLLIRTAAGFFAGVVTYFVCRATRNISAGVGAAALVTGGILATGLMLYPRSGPHLVLVEAAITLVCAPLLVFGCVNSKLMERLGRSSVGALIGDLSYSIYMWHFPVAAILVLCGATALDARILFYLYLAIVVVVAWVSFRFIEGPARIWIVSRSSQRVLRAV
ncbi:acyltransferase family protein [Microvirga flavescens]|uniref:acyltransferase family protein n=1 Tax=Microvirga flavescens TaxID=2249811 RepID=UPI00130026B3|nr:acyltransferase [Microvirga flavescens]